MKTKLLTALIFMTLSMPLMAKEVTTLGATDCGKWIYQPSEIKKSWFVGFMSGLNIANGQARDVLVKLDSAEQLFLWLDNYCKKHPLETVSDAGLILYEELMTK